MFKRLHVLMNDEPGASGGAGGDPTPAGGDPSPTGGDPSPTGGDPSPGTGLAPSGGDPTPGDPAPAGSDSVFYQNLPKDWRTQLAGDDDKMLPRLERYTDLPAVIKAGFEAQDRIRRGEMSNGLPENPTTEQMAAYREANGIPESADKYELKLDDGLILSNEDNRILKGVYETAFAENVPAKTVSNLVNAHLKGRELERQARTQQDGIDKVQANNVLNETWGSDYQTNVNMVGNLINQMPEAIRDNVAGARMADGRALFNSPEIMVVMADWARKMNPAGAVVGDTNNPGQTIDNEIATLEKRMREDEDGWYKDKAAQKRYMDLLEAKERMTA